MLFIFDQQKRNDVAELFKKKDKNER